jgi:alpha-1,2-mannosyltransferase
VSAIAAIRVRSTRGPVLTWMPAVLSTAVALGVAMYMAFRSYQVDIDVYRMGGRHVFHTDLYSVHFGGLFFTYTPFAALVFALPALNLAISSLQQLWAVTNIVALAGLIYMSIRVILPRLERRRAVRWSLVLLLPAFVLNPVFVTVGLGQINLVLCLLLTWDLASNRKIGSRTIPLGIATGICAAIKLTPLIFVPYLLITRRVRGAFNAGATFLACQAIAFLVSPQASRTYWTKDVLDSKRAGALLYTSDQNLMSALQRFHHGAVPATILVSALAIIGIAGLALAAWAHRRSSVMLGLLVCATSGLVISPITWVHHLVWVVPLIIWMAVAPDRPRAGRVLAGITAVLFLVSPIWWVPTSWQLTQDAPELHQNHWQLVAGNSFFFAMLIFLVGVAVMLFRRRRAPGLGAPETGRGAQGTGLGAPGTGRGAPGTQSLTDHLDELGNGSPITRGGASRESFLDEGVVQL